MEYVIEMLNIRKEFIVSSPMTISIFKSKKVKYTRCSVKTERGNQH